MPGNGDQIYLDYFYITTRIARQRPGDAVTCEMLRRSRECLDRSWDLLKATSMGGSHELSHAPERQLHRPAVAMSVNEILQPWRDVEAVAGASFGNLLGDHTSRDQPSAVLKAMTRAGFEYCPSIRSMKTLARSVRSSSVSRQARPSWPKSSSTR